MLVFGAHKRSTSARAKTAFDGSNPTPVEWTDTWQGGSLKYIMLGGDDGLKTDTGATTARVADYVGNAESVGSVIAIKPVAGAAAGNPYYAYAQQQ